LLKETGILSFVLTILKILLPLFIGFVIAWLFNPLVKWLEKYHIKRVLGTTLIYVVLLGILYAIIATFIPLLSQQIGELAKILPSVFETVKVWITGFLDSLNNIQNIDVDSIKMEVIEKANEIGIGITKALPNALFEFISGTFSVFGVIGVGLIIGFFLLVSFENTSNLFGFVPKKYRNSTMQLVDEVNDSLRKYVQGAIIDCTVVFILCSIGLWIVGLKAPLLFGLFCGITNIIPYAGPYIGGAPAVLVGLTQDPLIGILSLIVIVVVQFLEGNILQPFIMAKTTKLHPVTIMLGLLVFGHFFGILGMLLSTPIIAALKTIFVFMNRKYEILENQSVEKEE
jgi:predicted PurR-regulated permease PerM